ncbi:MAG: outer membrane protein transport protein [Gammaproteobacteria bacterium]|nr:outer membrane protein transport protein [Gammaproteobacteria bacterium]
MSLIKTTKITFLLTATLASASSYASGFAIQEQSVAGLGRAFAGSAVVADDTSTILFNPARLSYLSQDKLAFGLHYIFPQSDFTDGGSSIPTAFGGTPQPSNDGSDPGQDAIVPNLFYAKRINEKLVAGIGITAPFGLVTEYKDTWQGRYHAIRSDLKQSILIRASHFNPMKNYQLEWALLCNIST